MSLDGGRDFVEWREQFISQERGSRLVHYYLEDFSGESHLAVVGTEKSVRHMLYVVSEEFCENHGANRLGVSGLKWRSRREVVDWLTSFLPRRNCSRDYYLKSPKNGSESNLWDETALNGVDDPGTYRRHPEHLGRTLKEHNTDIVWSGVSWTCGKQLRHFQAFHRNGTTIATHSFVLVLSEDDNRYLAYLEDMYEDKKGQKKVKVRWFHQNQEFTGSIPPPKPHPREVFITPCCQVISAECVDDLATVLTPKHYEKCVSVRPHAYSAGIHLCFRQYNKKRFKLFDLTSLSGYFDQVVLSSLDICTTSGEEGLGANHGRYKRIRLAKELPYNDMRYGLPVKRPVSVKFVGPRHWLFPPYKVEEKIELLCQDSGIRGCWFRCTVMRLSQKRLKVRYDDVHNDDECGNLEEWVPAFKSVFPDKLGVRCSGRLTIRPCPSHSYVPDDVVLRIGTPVDSWWNDGWWEGVVIGVESSGDDSLQVYFPGEDVFLTRQRKDLRISRDWVRNQWVDLNANPNILSAISRVSLGTKVSKAVESGSSAMFDHDVTASKVESVKADRVMERRDEGADEALDDGDS